MTTLRETKGTVFDIKELSVHDGPGTRVTVFLKGCPLRCLWCHNPEGFAPQPELLVKENNCMHCGRCMQPCTHPQCRDFGRCIYACPLGLLSVSGKEMTAAAVADRVLPLNPFLDADGGGITLSGGEVLLQADFASAVLQLCAPMHRVIQTSGFSSPETFEKVLEHTDLVLFDIKHADSNIHQTLTGVPNEPILRNLQRLRKSGKPFWIRVPVIPGCNDDAENLEAVAAIAAQGGNLQRVELLRYNPYAGAKYPWLGKQYPLHIAEQEQRIDPSPFERRGLPVFIQ